MLTAPPGAPLRTMSQSDFDIAVAARMAWDPINVTELTALQIDVVAKQVTASAAATTAVAALGSAQVAALTAVINAGLTAADVGSTHADVVLTHADVISTHADAAIAAAAANTMPTATAGGTVDAITADFSPDITLSSNRLCRVICAGANTITTPTFSPDGLTVRTIKARGGQALLVGDIPAAGFNALFSYNLAGTYWELMNPQGVAPVVPPAAGLGSVTYLAQASNKQLVATDAGTIVFSTTAPDVGILMPNATTLSTNRIYILRNTGLFASLVYDFDGNALCSIPAAGGAILWGTSIATTAGAWAKLDGASSAILSGPLSVMTTANASIPCIVYSSTDRAVILWSAISTQYMTGAVLTLNNANIVSGPVVTVNAQAIQEVCAVNLATDKMLVTFVGAALPSSTSQVMTINNVLGVMTPQLVGSPYTTAYAARYPRIARISATSVLQVSNDVVNGFYVAEVMTVSANNVAGTTPLTTTLAPSGTSGMDVQVFSSTRAILMYYDSGSPFYMKACILTLTTTTVFQNTSSPINAVASSNPRSYLVDSTRVVLCFTSQAQTTAYVVMLTLSGTSFTQGTILSWTSTSTFPPIISVINASKIVVGYSSSAGFQTRTLTYSSGSTLTDSAQGLITADAQSSGSPPLFARVGDKVALASLDTTLSRIIAAVLTGANTL